MLCILLIGCGLCFSAEYKMPEDKDLSLGTSVIRHYVREIDNAANVEGYKYGVYVNQSSKKRLKDMSYVFADEFQLPRDVYLQGICFTEKFVLITSYADEQKTLGKIMIYDKETGEYLLSLGMDESSHLGGIAYDGSSIWVCNSSKMALERISYTFICVAAANHRGESLDIRNLVELYPVKLIPSCITFHDGLLWIATHKKYTNSTMMSYQFDVLNNELNFESVYQIPSKVQGVVFDENGRIIFSTSYGRKNSSFLKIYPSVEKMSISIDEYEQLIELPPCSEGIDINNQQLFIIFESAGEKYLEGTDGKGKSIAPLDKILIIDLT